MEENEDRDFTRCRKIILGDYYNVSGEPGISWGARLLASPMQLAWEALLTQAHTSRKVLEVQREIIQAQRGVQREMFQVQWEEATFLVTLGMQIFL